MEHFDTRSKKGFTNIQPVQILKFYIMQNQKNINQKEKSTIYSLGRI